VEITIRPIEKKDNAEMAEVIRKVLREFKIDKPGTVYTDPTTDNLYELFQIPKAIYWVAEENGKIVGGCGIYPTTELPARCAELVKYYVASEERGKGIGKKLMEYSFGSAQEFGYTQLYLESLPELDKAVGIYKKAGFKTLPAPLGNSGHFACNLWMLKNL
jgi:putative acetyltransferase